MSGELPYDVGNAGDLLKHGFLAEFVRAWSKHIDKVLVYFDPFAGLPWCEPVNKTVVSRLEELGKTALADAQPDLPERYYGSSFVVKNAGKAFGTVTDVYINDRNATRFELLKAANLQIIEEEGFQRANGYSILDTQASPDLLLIDPFDDFLPDKANEVIPKLSSFSESTTIVLFVLTPVQENEDLRRYRSLLKMNCTGGWLAKCPRIPESSVRGESTFHIELIILLAKILPKTMTSTLFRGYERYCKELTHVLNTGVTLEIIEEAKMAGQYCRGCGKHFPPPQHPKQCRQCGPLRRDRRAYCEFCGKPVKPEHPSKCDNCGHNAGYP